MALLTYTLLVVDQLKELFEQESNHSGPLLYSTNCYSPSMPFGDMELYRLQSKHRKLWKYTVLAYEITMPFLLSVSLTFWILLLPA